ncbi:class II aldolase/adducin family protein [candidate division KSB1 bacterium]|nr:class II aldolase/adducin family protein [candidate division KSB1 bacterium]
MQKTIYSLKRDIVEVGRRVYQRGYVASNDGNISVRLDEKRILITPTGVSKGFMSVEDIILVDLAGKVLAGNKKPSSEVFMHLAVYQARPDVNSVCHAHPIHATGFAVAGIPLDKCILPEVIISLGSIPVVEYGTPGTDEFFKPVLKYLKDHDAFLLANHGALTIGKDVFNAYYKMETLEHFAHIAYVAQQLGQVKLLNSEQVQKLYDLRKKFGITTEVSCKSCEESESGVCSVHQAVLPEKGQTVPNPAQGGSTAPSLDSEALVQEVTRAVLQKLKG